MKTKLESPELYTIGWIAALPIERAAAIVMLDDLHDAPEGFKQHVSDTNSYTWGRIGEHNIAIASLPAGVYGTTSAAATSLNLLSSLPQIRVGLLVGIGGGLARPAQRQDIRLGDVVVGHPSGQCGGVIQYDLGKAKSDQKWEQKGSLNNPPFVLLSAVSNLQAHHEMAASDIPNLLQAVWTKNPLMRSPMNDLPGYVHQGVEHDRLFQSGYGHVQGSTCDLCDPSGEIKRKERRSTSPKIHYGTIASGNTLVKDAVIRDRISAMIGDSCMCFEMEAAGLMDRFPCLVVRGICDYADSHKNDQWQRYASATAAAYAKELLGFVATAQLRATQRAIDVLESIDVSVKNIESLSTQTQHDMQIVSTNVRNSHQMALLERLPVAEGASYDSYAEAHNPTCLEDTRVDILQDISTWANSPSTKSLFWFNGKAGTGKSTISRTVARSFGQQGILGASFFFKRGESDRGNSRKLMTTIATQMAVRKPAVSAQLAKVIEADSTTINSGLREQFTKLILEPLQEISQHTRRPDAIVIVIDALDECEQDEDIRLLIYLLSGEEGVQSIQLKTFVTSRPELRIRLGFHNISGNYQGLVLHEIPEPVVGHDISVYFQHELARIRDEFNTSVVAERRLSLDWPGESVITALVQMSIPLFIFAATTCRFLADRTCGNPDKQLREVLQFQTRSQESKLDATYLPVLNQLTCGLSKREEKEILQQFQLIIGSIINLASPLSVSALSKLLSIQTADINDRLDMLHSVLNIPPSEHAPIRLLHLSFRDFLLDPEKSETNPFWINERQTHGRIAGQCLRIMNCLQQDMCKIKFIGTDRSIINKRTVDTCIPLEVRYACQYWTYHMQKAEVYAPDSKQVYGFLTRHFLHWLEALSLIGQATECIGFVKTLQTVSKSQDNVELSAFLDDALRFVLANVACIHATPLQLYSSLLIFAPMESKVRASFETNIPSWIPLKPKTNSHWAQYLQTLEGHTGPVNTVIFSHDSRLVASGSDDETIRIWKVGTGEYVQSLRGHRWAVKTVAFSHDSKLLASGGMDGTVRIWRSSTGECVKTLTGHGHSVNSVSFSHNSTLLVSASEDMTIRIWCTNTGNCTQILTCNTFGVELAVFSNDGLLVLSACQGGYIKTWCTSTGKAIHIKREQERGENGLAIFSPDSRLVAVISNEDNKIRICYTNTGQVKQTLMYQNRGVRSVAFSHDSELLASGSCDRKIQIWRVSTGECIQLFEGGGNIVTSLAFSHDSTLLVSACFDDAVRIWPTKSSKSPQDPECREAEVDSVTFSHDSSLVATYTASIQDSYKAVEYTIRLWRTDTGECMHTLRGHESYIWSVVFSQDSTLLVSTSRDGAVRVWRVITGKCVRTLNCQPSRSGIVTLSHDSKILALPWMEKIQLCYVDTGECLHTLSVRNLVTTVAFSHDSHLLAAASADGTTFVWETDTKECIHISPGYESGVSFAFSHDSKLLAIADRHQPTEAEEFGKVDVRIRIWCMDTGEYLQALRWSGHVWSLRSSNDVILAFSHDSILLAACLDYNNAHIWRTDTAECVQVIKLYRRFRGAPYFGRDDRHRLITLHGAFVVRDTPLVGPLVDSAENTVCTRDSPYSISEDGSWVQLNGKNLLWIPMEYRTERWAVSKSTLVSGCVSGRVMVIRFSSYEDPEFPDGTEV